MSAPLQAHGNLVFAGVTGHTLVATCDTPERANHIVRCVNERDELVAALQFCIRYDGGECLADHPEWLARARLALAMAAV